MQPINVLVSYVNTKKCCNSTRLIGRAPNTIDDSSASSFIYFIQKSKEIQNQLIHIGTAVRQQNTSFLELSFFRLRLKVNTKTSNAKIHGNVLERCSFTYIAQMREA